MYSLVFVLLCSTFFLVSAQAQQKEESISLSNLSAETLLKKFVDNGAQQLFDGTFVYLFEDAVKTTKVHREANKEGLILEEFVPLDNAQKQTTRTLAYQHCSLDNAWLYQFQAIPSSFPFRINNHYKYLQKNYDFTLSELTSVAGIPAIGLFVRAKDAYRYGYHLWFDIETATLLKYQLVGRKNKIIEQYLFTNIAFSKKAKNKKMGNSKEIPACVEKFKGLSSEYKHFFIKDGVPNGFIPVSFYRDEFHNASQFQLSDGIATVSVFIEKKIASLPKKKDAIKPMLDGVLKLGPISVAGRKIGNYQVTVLGAIPVQSALHFLNAIKELVDD